MKYITAFVCIFLISIKGNAQIFSPDSTIQRVLSHIGYPNQGLQDSSINSIVLAVIYHSADGKIDSIIASPDNIFTRHIKNKLQATDGHWKIKDNAGLLPIVIPFVFQASDDDAKYPAKKNYLPDAETFRTWLHKKPFPCIFYTPVLILGYSVQY